MSTNGLPDGRSSKSPSVSTKYTSLNKVRRIGQRIVNLFRWKSDRDNRVVPCRRISTYNPLHPTSTSSPCELSKIITKDIPNDLTLVSQRYEESRETFEGMTEEEIASIQSSWQLLKQEMEHIGVVAFLDMLEKHCDLRNLFTGPDEADAFYTSRCLLMIKTIDKIISQLNNRGSFRAIVMPLGSRHYSRVTELKLFEQATKNLFDVVKSHLEEHQRWDVEVERLWCLFLFHLTNSMTYALVTRVHAMWWREGRS